MGIASGMDAQVVRMAKLAESSGLDGVVCSPREIQMIRAASETGFQDRDSRHSDAGPVRGRPAANRDSHEAITAGADYIVVGRAVTNAPDPRAAIEAMLQGA